MKITEDVRKYAAEHGLPESEAIESGMREKEERICRKGFGDLPEEVNRAYERLFGERRRK